jgi:curved DNA-binding protein CbpA
MNTFTDYYALLGVASDASPEKIKAAFKKLALQYHPDVYKGADANERMSQLLRAYQTLSNPVTRKNYDLQYSEHSLHVYLPGNESSPASTRASNSQSHSSQGSGKTVSPAARRDRQRHYDFPSFAPDKGVRVNLSDIDYALSASEAQQLLRDGLLRGVASETKGEQYFCHRCHHHWRDKQVYNKSGSFPHFCPNCHAKDWPEYLLLRCLHCSAVFESEQIRYEIGSYSYEQGHMPGQGNIARKTGLCPPYELFPLCPYCGTSRWSAAENTRVSELRERVNQHVMVVRFVWISVVVIVLLSLGLLIFGGH